jgi:glycosyltransferase involved in cell wall biosynthesis
MRILVAAERIGSAGAKRLGHAGGMERFLDIVLRALAARGTTVHVLARDAGGDAPDGVTVQRVAWADEHDEPDAAAHAEAERALRAFAPDAAVAHNVMDAGIVEALRAAPRLAYHVHDHRPFCPEGDRVFPRSGRICTRPLGFACAANALLEGCGYGPRPRTLALIRRRERLRDAIAASDTVVVASKYVGERAARSGVPHERITEIPLPLPDEAYAVGSVRDDGSSPTPRVPTIAFAGRVVPQKGLDSLVRAVARIAPAQRPVVRAFGAGPALDGVRRLAAELGVGLDAPGAVAPDAVRAGFDDAALVALPSRWAEPFGYAGIEAFARARTVVAYDVGGVRAWLDDGANGVAVAPGDERALADALAALLADDARRARLSLHARADAERFRAAPIVDALLSAYWPR